MSIHFIYLFDFVLAVILSVMFCCFFRGLALRYNIMDCPNAQLKTHATATPYLGGAGIALSFVISMFIIFKFNHDEMAIFQLNLALIMGGMIVLLLGALDDIIKQGLSFKTKFAVQFIASMLLLHGLNIHLAENLVIYLIYLVWIIGVMNAVNIIDIMDGLAGTTIVIASLGLLFISKPSETVYVETSAAVLAGAVFGFLPYNFSAKRKMFMGDTGSLFAGYVLCAITLAAQYSSPHAKIIAPVLLLGVPVFDTFLVMFIRYRKGISPFKGSKDHFALRMQRMGLKPTHVLFAASIASAALCYCAFLSTQIGPYGSLAICGFVFIFCCLTGKLLAKKKYD